jgi:hypothetical protein
MSNLRLRYAALTDTRPETTRGHLGTLELAPRFGYVPQSLELGTPVMRETSQRNPGHHGEDDRTALMGARAVTLVVALLPEAVPDATEQSLMERLWAWTNPALTPRPALDFARQETDGIRRVYVRAESSSWSEQYVTPGFTIVPLSWRVPDGTVWGDEVSVSVRPSLALDEIPGRAYDLSFDRLYPEAPWVGFTVLRNLGSRPVSPIIRFYGPCTGPMLEVRDPAMAVRFDSTVVLNRGEHVALDCATGIATINGDARQQVGASLVYPDTTLPLELPVGISEVRFRPQASETGAAAVVTYRHPMM